jgi:uncharacterized membrane-anchored protein
MLSSNAARSVAAGVLSVGVLAGMLVLHAWPLWTGESIYLKVRPVDPRDLFRGDYVTLGYDVDNLQLRVPRDSTTSGAAPPPPVAPVPQPGAPAAPAIPQVDPIGDWWKQAAASDTWRDRRLYVQLRPEPSSVPGVPEQFVPISVSEAPVDDAVNLAGRLIYYTGDHTLRLDFGIDAIFVEEGAGRPIEEAIRRETPVFAEVAVTRRGTARVRALIIDGQHVR